MYSFIQKSAVVRFGSLNTLITLPVEKPASGRRNLVLAGETGDIILLNEIKGLSKISLVAMCFVLQKSL